VTINETPGAIDFEIKKAIDEFRTLPEFKAEELLEIEKVAAGVDTLSVDENLTVEKEGEATANVITEKLPESDDIRIRISKMRLPEKIKMAIFGNSIARGLLIRDAQKLIQLYVLKNPRLTVKEVEEFCRNSNLSENVLRTIAASSTWMKNYHVKLNLVSNPKTPGDIALKWLRYINMPDLKRLSKSKQIPNLISVTAKKHVLEAEKK